MLKAVNVNINSYVNVNINSYVLCRDDTLRVSVNMMLESIEFSRAPRLLEVLPRWRSGLDACTSSCADRTPSGAFERQVVATNVLS